MTHHVWDNCLPDSNQSVESACHQAAAVFKAGMENNPLLRELASLPLPGVPECLPEAGLPDGRVLKMELQAIDEKLHRYGLLPNLHIGCDERNMPTLVLDPAGTKTDCFGYMHVPQLGLGQLINPPHPGRLDLSHGHYDEGGLINQDAGAAKSGAGGNSGEKASTHIEPQI